ncbi:MAG: DUF2269 domain-containing protein [Actinomycetota bacterium]|nr:DUF2269 domain-containing protein [Actinomycetota bacterium]MDQ2982344.1 DUF2269 domain-containing protein [Actinomycetota bacterium]
MSRYDWLVALHVTGAFLVIGGAVAAGVLNIAAQGRERPSEVALLLGLIRPVVLAVSAGLLITLGFGIWLVHEAGFGFGDGWVIAALILLVIAGVLGDLGGKRDRKTRELAERWASEGDTPQPELRARLRDPVSLALSYGSGVLVLVILGLMIWKPGA